MSNHELSMLDVVLLAARESKQQCECMDLDLWSHNSISFIYYFPVTN